MRGSYWGSGEEITMQGPSSLVQTLGGVMFASGPRGLRLWWGLTNTSGAVFRPHTAVVSMWKVGKFISMSRCQSKTGGAFFDDNFR